MIAIPKRFSTPRNDLQVVVTVPPVPQFEVGDRVTFDLMMCFGEMCSATGVVIPSLCRDADDNIVEIPSTVSVEYECQIPPEDGLDPMYRRGGFSYPKEGIHRGSLTLPSENVSHYSGDQLQLVLGEVQSSNRSTSLPSREFSYVAVFEGQVYYSESKQGCWHVATREEVAKLKRGDRVSVLEQNWVYAFRGLEGEEALASFVGHKGWVRIPLEKLQVAGLVEADKTGQEQVSLRSSPLEQSSVPNTEHPVTEIFSSLQGGGWVQLSSKLIAKVRQRLIDRPSLATQFHGGDRPEWKLHYGNQYLRLADYVPTGWTELPTVDGGQKIAL